MMNVICLKWGDKYGPEYVNKLYNMTQRHTTIPFRFVCFTDNQQGLDSAVDAKPLLIKENNVSGWWHKISFFQDEIYDLEGDLFFMDLDVVIINKIDKFFKIQETNEFIGIWDWVARRKDIEHFNSSIFKMPIGKFSYIWHAFEQNASAIMRRLHGDQDWISECIKNKIYWPKDWCLSYKFDMCQLESIHKNSSIVVFHGKPDPHEAIRGFKHYPPAPWIANCWR